jgi:transcriptional regulator with XRE-family HTH domain
MATPCLPVLQCVKSWWYCALMTQGKEWEARLTADLAERVRRLRERQGMSAQDLADRCTALGFPVQRSVLANLENGRRAQVSVGEVLVLARALNVSPVTLLFSVGAQERTEILPDTEADTWAALRWWTGEDRMPLEPLGEEEGRVAYGAALQPVSVYRELNDLYEEAASAFIQRVEWARRGLPSEDLERLEAALTRSAAVRSRRIKELEEVLLARGLKPMQNPLLSDAERGGA